MIDMWRARRGGPFEHTHDAFNLRGHTTMVECAIELRCQARHPDLLAQFLAERDPDQGQGSLDTLQEVLFQDGSGGQSPK